jgi:hypothetical protein
VGYEHGNAVSNSNCQRDSLLGRDMSIGLVAAEPPFPAPGMHQHASPVDLSDGSESSSRLGEIVLDGGPPTHHLVNRIVAREAESAGVTGGRERADPPSLEVRDYFFRNLTHAYWRRSSTRVIAAPSLLRRSSIRS